MSRLNNLCSMMIEFYRDDPARIQHFIKVHSFAKLIGKSIWMRSCSIFWKRQLMYMILESARRRLNLADVTANCRSRKVRQRQRKC